MTILTLSSELSAFGVCISLKVAGKRIYTYYIKQFLNEIAKKMGKKLNSFSNSNLRPNTE